MVIGTNVLSADELEAGIATMSVHAEIHFEIISLFVQVISGRLYSGPEVSCTPSRCRCLPACE